MSAQQGVELKRCPFCNCDASIRGEGPEDSRNPGFYVACNGASCFVAVGEGYDRDAMPDHSFSTEQDAAAAWNRRAELIERSEREGVRPVWRYVGFGATGSSWMEGTPNDENRERGTHAGFTIETAHLVEAAPTVPSGNVVAAGPITWSNLCPSCQQTIAEKDDEGAYILDAYAASIMADASAHERRIVADLMAIAQQNELAFWPKAIALAARGMILRYKQAAASAQPKQECQCTLRGSLVGDGCAVCNPEYAAQFAEPAQPKQEREGEAVGTVLVTEANDGSRMAVPYLDQAAALLSPGRHPLYSHPPAADERDALAVNLLGAARTYFNNYCLDEADENGPAYTGCSREQHEDAKALGIAIAALAGKEGR